MTRRVPVTSSDCAVRSTYLAFMGQLLMVLLCTVSASAAAAQDDDPNEGEVTQFLLETQNAARQNDYSGVFAYQQGASLQSSRVIHVVDGTGERERLSILDGEAREFIRHNDIVQCILPAKELVLVEQHRMDRFPGVLVGKDRDLDENYILRKHETSHRVAGHQCMPVDLVPRDEFRYGYRFCVDPDTKLLIKSQTVDAQGNVVNQIAFTSLQQGSDVQADELEIPWDLQGWRKIEIVTKSVNIAEHGWRITPPPGFQHNMQILRPLKAGHSVMQAVLTDGLAAISVFIEPLQLTKPTHSRAKGARRDGAMSLYSTRIGDYWLTAIGEVPSATLRHLVDHIEYVPPSGALQ